MGTQACQGSVCRTALHTVQICGWPILFTARNFYLRSFHDNRTGAITLKQLYCNLFLMKQSCKYILQYIFPGNSCALCPTLWCCLVLNFVWPIVQFNYSSFHIFHRISASAPLFILACIYKESTFIKKQNIFSKICQKVMKLYIKWPKNMYLHNAKPCRQIRSHVAVHTIPSSKQCQSISIYYSAQHTYCWIKRLQAMLNRTYSLLLHITRTPKIPTSSRTAMTTANTRATCNSN